MDVSLPMSASASEQTPSLGTGEPGPPPSRGSARKQVTRQRLLDAGLALFAEHGPHAVTTHVIAAEAGLASGTFYLHFTDKLALFRELAEEAASELEARLLAVSRPGPDPHPDARREIEQIVSAQAEALVGFAEERRDLLRIVFHPESETGDIGARILARLAAGVSSRRRERIAAGLAEDCFDPDVLAQATVGMWAHVLAWWAEDPTRATRDALVRTLTHFQLHGNRSAATDLCGFTEPATSEAPSRRRPVENPFSRRPQENPFHE